VPRKWIGVKMNGRAIPRNGFECVTEAAGERRSIGYVTSGSYCPTLGGAYALCLVERDAVKAGDTVIIPIRGRTKRAWSSSAHFWLRRQPTRTTGSTGTIARKR